MSKVTVLFKKAARDEIEEACCARGIVLPESFHTEGQVFENVVEKDIDNGVLSLTVPKKRDGEPVEGQWVVYDYPLSDIARIKEEDNEDTNNWHN